MLTVVAMGLNKDDLTIKGLNVLKNADVVIVKSERTHMSETLKEHGIEYISCDDLYDKAEDFLELDKLIVKRLNQQQGNIAFCIVGSGTDDSTVDYLKQHNVPFETVYGVSAEQYVNPVCDSNGVRVFTAQQFVDCTNVTAVATVVKYIDDSYIASDVKLKLQSCFDYDNAITVYDGRLYQSTLDELDRLDYNHLTTIYIRPNDDYSKRKVFDFKDVMDVMHILRSPNGCPWDREQTHESIRKNVIEESYELAQAIEDNDIDNMVEELGDMLMQIAFHIEIAMDDSEFTAEDVYTALCRKLVDRHPHVFGEVQAVNSQQSLDSWEKIKAQQHKIKNLTENLRDIPKGMSALMRCNKAQYRAGKQGYDFVNLQQVEDSLLSELNELKNAPEDCRQEEGGDLLFSVVNLLRWYGVDAETALLTSTEKFINRVIAVEKKLEPTGKKLKELTPEQFDQLWAEVKKEMQ